MNNSWQAMVLAAGFGKRLYPLTKWMPKPMVPMTRKPLLFHVTESIFRTGIRDVGVNSHHLHKQIEAFIAQSEHRDQFTLFHEEVILNTGGALVNARKFLKRKPYFLLHNSDIVTDLDLVELMKKHQESGAMVTMAFNNKGHQNVVIGKDGEVKDIRGLKNIEPTSDMRRATYASISAFSTEFLNYLPDGPSDWMETVIELLDSRPGSVRAYYDENFFWSDLGTFEEFLKTQRNLIDRKAVEVAHPARPLIEQGSNRRYYRLGEEANTLVLMLCEYEDPDFKRFIQTTDFLNSLQLGNPAMWAWSGHHYAALLEDLGDDTLYSIMQKEPSSIKVRTLYQKVIQFLVDFHLRAFEASERCPAATDRSMDYEHLRWETRYFTKYFLIKRMGYSEDLFSVLDEEFDMLANEVASHPQTLIHRDFQSQNIMLKEGEVHIVDYQGMRLGSITYDIMSLLNDPYVNLDEEMKSGMKKQFIQLINQRPEFTASAETWAKRMTSSGLQRNMQALGAYAFLSGEKGKVQFEQFMLPGIQILAEGIRDWNQQNDKQLLNLAEIVNECMVLCRNNQ
ncbi:MAG: hypothetical protein CR997_09950 [Acidobacteria bacterium]|nr:MAG: hypothetical protein CR997_09950 [Acidobacteriota bacterium]